MNKKTDYAWAAGVIDGEGCIYIARHKGGGGNGALSDHYHVALKVTMGHKPTIERLRNIFGKVGSSHRVDQQGWNLAYTWLAQANLVREVLEKIKPYCLTKSKEIDVAFEFLNRPRWFGGHFRGPKSKSYQQMEYRLWDKMRMLKPRTRFRILKDRNKR